MEFIGQHQFSWEDQLWFANLSGDFNPLHVDQHWARRSIAGEPVLHGIHGVLVALYKVMEKVSSCTIQSIECSFLEYITIGQMVDFYYVIEESKLRILIKTTDRTYTRISCLLGRRKKDNYNVETSIKPRRPPKKQVLDCTFDDLKKNLGIFFSGFDEIEVSKLYPGLSEKYEPELIGALINLSALVGMDCPGKNALFKGFKIRLKNKGQSGNKSKWWVKRAAFPLLVVQIDSDVAEGTVSSFYIENCTDQIGMNELTYRVGRHEFAHQRALIIGGSRGLGELTAKIIAAGGGRPCITWCHGQLEALKVSNEIKQSGFYCKQAQLDIDNLDTCISNSGNFGNPTHIYYFASPKISARQEYETYARYYVSSFKKVVLHFLEISGTRNVFYPSTIFIGQCPKGLEAYAEAKHQGELLCENMSETSEILAFSARLPKLRTDQNIGLIREDFPDSANTMLSHIREFNSVSQF
ncbi:MAG: MaoC/PaaZ C-terminal domain-containing protein [Oligoflexales bacterium]